MSNEDATSWRKELDDVVGEGDPLIACTLTDEELDRVFDGGFGGTEGVPFTAWSRNRVYFPLCYDGSEWVGSAPRNPCDEKCSHDGGG